MTSNLRKQAHNCDVTVWAGKSGIDPVVEELATQLDTRDVVKVKFLRAARSQHSTEELAKTLAERSNATLFETRGNTAVFH